MKATRDWFGEALENIAGPESNTVVVNADLGSAVKTQGFRDRYPHRFFECGIAEANAIGIASGLALEGLRPFVASFGHFLTGKFLEIFQSVGLNHAPVVLVGTHAGLAIGKDGPTQMGLRDLALMRTLPNVQILQPADGVETRAMMTYLVGRRTPAYLRLCRQPQAEVHGKDYRFEFGAPDLLRDGDDLAVLTMGGPTDLVVAAADELAREEGVRVAVVNISSMPVDREALRALYDRFSCVLVAEDHYAVGGLADEVRGSVADRPAGPRLVVRAVSDFGQAAAPSDLYRRYGLDQPSLTRLMRELATSRQGV